MIDRIRSAFVVLMLALVLLAGWVMAHPAVPRVSTHEGSTLISGK